MQQPAVVARQRLAQALQRRHQFRGQTEEEEQAWLFALARTQLSRYWRRGRVERAALLRYAVDVPSLTDSEIDRVELLAGLQTPDAGALLGAMRAAADALPDDTAAVVLHRAAL